MAPWKQTDCQDRPVDGVQGSRETRSMPALCLAMHRASPWTHMAWRTAGFEPERRTMDSAVPHAIIFQQALTVLQYT